MDAERRGAQAMCTPTAPAPHKRSMRTIPMASTGRSSTSLMAFVFVVLTSTLAFQLNGKSILVHFVVLLAYGALFCAVGAIFFGKQQEGDNRNSNNINMTMAAVGIAGGFRATNGATAAAAAPAENGHTSQQQALPNSSNRGNNTQPTAGSGSTFNWVGETVEGSVNWLRGAGGYASNSGAGSGGASPQISSRGTRERSSSDGSAGIVGSWGADIGNGGGSAATSPGGRVGSGGGYGSSEPGAGFPIIGFGRAAAATAEAAFGHTQRHLRRARGWSRTLGGGGGRNGSVVDGDDGGSSGDDMDAGDEAAGGGAEWMVGVGMGDGRCVMIAKNGVRSFYACWMSAGTSG